MIYLGDFDYSLQEKTELKDLEGALHFALLIVCVSKKAGFTP